MVGRRDYKYGPHYYAPVWKWDDEGVIHELFDGFGVSLEPLFDNIYCKFVRRTGEGVEVPYYVNVGVNPSEIELYWKQLYDERRVAFPYYPCSEEGNEASLDRMIGVFASVLAKNNWKYKKLVETLGLEYDPIENYNMNESGTDELTPTGTTTKNHNVSSDKVGMIRLTAKTQIGQDMTQITKDETTGQFQFTSVGVENEGQKITRADGVSDIQAGKTATRSETTEDPSVADGDTPTTKNYVTTMDSAAENRLHDYSETEGATAQQSFNDIKEDIPPMIEIQSGNPHFASYTDTETFDSRKDTKTHNFARSGNIGVTTSQQMIEQQRNLVRYSVLEEFFNDINHELLLAAWD